MVFVGKVVLAMFQVCGREEEVTGKKERLMCFNGFPRGCSVVLVVCVCCL